jgi:hypothetical protein
MYQYPIFIEIGKKIENRNSIPFTLLKKYIFPSTEFHDICTDQIPLRENILYGISQKPFKKCVN